MISKRAILVALAAFAESVPAHADVTISTDATQNMTCSGGICAPTASNAVLNVADLEKLLEAGAATVTTTGSGIQANNIVVADGLTWTSKYQLKFDAYQSITFQAQTSIDGRAKLVLTTNDGGANGVLSFGKGGHIQFSDLSSTLVINGTSFTLVDSIQGLAGNANGTVAFAKDYNAARDGTYSTPPLSTFGGTLEGLGNFISNLSINVSESSYSIDVGLIADASGTIRDLGLTNADVEGTGAGLTNMGTLVGDSTGTIFGCHAAGMVKLVNSGYGNVGGLVGQNSGTIANSHTNVAVLTKQVGRYIGGFVGVNAYPTGTIKDSYAIGPVTAKKAVYVGGLVGTNDSEISGSFATGPVTLSLGAKFVAVGGLVGLDYLDFVENSYATGSVQGHSWVGGLIGAVDKGSLSGDGAAYSYSTGLVSGPSRKTGGFFGANNAKENTATYWNITTSGTDKAVGDGRLSQSRGTTGLTTQQLQSGLPSGFDPSVWAENSLINNGFPYLIANPPPN